MASYEVINEDKSKLKKLINAIQEIKEKVIDLLKKYVSR